MRRWKRWLVLIVAGGWVVVCALLRLSWALSGSPVVGEGIALHGFGNQGQVPGGGTCDRVGAEFPDNPVHGWPVNFHVCDWAIISAYFCTPNYFPGYTHWGIDLASAWNVEPAESIGGVEVVTTVDVGVVRQAVYTNPPQWNHGMGNFVQVEAYRPVQYALTPTPTFWPYIPTPTATPACTGNARQDWEEGRFAACWETTGWRVTYMHLQDVLVDAGSLVLRGEVLGHVDNTGNSTGNHLHYQINGPGEIGAVDPAVTFGCPGYDWAGGVEKGR